MPRGSDCAWLRGMEHGGVLPDSEVLIYFCLMLRLNESETVDLLAQPETGMGYQVVEATLEDGRREWGVAYNAELLSLGDETQRDLRNLSYATILESAESSSRRIRNLRVLERRQLAHNPVRTRPSAAAAYAPIVMTNAKEIFVRFVAYANDRRLRPDRSWRNGTYATTEQDAHQNIQTGMDAVNRYALPNPAPASFVFTRCPYAGTSIQRGIAVPANNRPGGGVEVIFTNGTQLNTVTGHIRIRDR